LEIGPEVQVYGPESPFTQILRHHRGVRDFRKEWAEAGYPPVYPPPGEIWIFEIEKTAPTPLRAYVQENIKMLLSFAGFGSPTPEGPINPLGGVVGSYDVEVYRLDGSAMFIVKNETKWESGTRVPGTNYALLPPLTRSQTDWATTLMLAAEAPLAPIVAPIVIARPELAAPIQEINTAVLGIARQAPGEWGGVGGKMVQVYYWVEPIEPVLPRGKR
jgi:hypothetical protein